MPATTTKLAAMQLLGGQCTVCGESTVIDLRFHYKGMGGNHLYSFGDKKKAATDNAAFEADLVANVELMCLNDLGKLPKDALPNP